MGQKLLREYYELCDGGVCQDLLTEEEKKHFEEEDTQDPDFAEQEFHKQKTLATSPYEEPFKTSHPRHFLDTLINLGDK